MVYTSHHTREAYTGYPSFSHGGGHERLEEAKTFLIQGPERLEEAKTLLNPRS